MPRGQFKRKKKQGYQTGKMHWTQRRKAAQENSLPATVNAGEILQQAQRLPAAVLSQIVLDSAVAKTRSTILETTQLTASHLRETARFLQTEANKMMRAAHELDEVA